MFVKKILQLSATTLLFNLVACGGSSTTDPAFNQSPIVYPSYVDVINLGGSASAIGSSNSGHGFSTPIPALNAEELALHLEGDANFETAFTTAPNAEHPELDGLGPVFNNQDCNSCHQRDGRPSTLVPAVGQERLLLGNNAGIFLRISIEDGDCDLPSLDNNFCKNTEVPGFGEQLFHRGVLTARPDWEDALFIGQANVYLSYEYHDFTYSDGTIVTLKKPIFEIDYAYDSPLDIAASTLSQNDVRFSPRNGMPIFGLGLLEAISEQDILELVDVEDSNADGISGRPNWVFDQVKALADDSFPVSLGRFGWKANTPTVRQQSLGALRGDIGITNEMFPEESIVGTPLHDSYLARTDYMDTGSDQNGEPEADKTFSDTVTFYAETLAVPQRRNIEDSDVREGARIFADINCIGCHTPSFTTRSDADLTIGGLPAAESLKNQKIYPFSDMLLHDMGDDLADNRRDFVANGHEWKTRPLWGIGLTQTVNPAAGFLHDGRAGTVEEAILWHGGEAINSRNLFSQLTAVERSQVLQFMRSL